MPDQRRGIRRLGAPTAALGWFLGLYAFPFLHNLDHEDDHTHGPSAEHHDPGNKHSHPVPVDSDHGAASVLHFAVAALETRTLQLPESGPLIPLPSPPALRRALSTPLREILVRGPPFADSSV